ncbi:MAG: hypothetical protein Fur0023_14820 [Bacteroidia bacterium]
MAAFEIEYITDIGDVDDIYIPLFNTLPAMLFSTLSINGVKSNESDELGDKLITTGANEVLAGCDTVTVAGYE